MPELRQLRTLTEVVATGSFHRTADRLCCVPSAVSNRMKALAEEVGVPLFEQDGRNIRPTAAGRRLARHAAIILALCDRAMADARSGATGAPILRLGVIDAAAGLHLPAWLRGLKDTEPDQPIGIETGHSVPLVEEVLAGRLDAAFVAGIWDQAPLVEEFRVPERLVLVTPRTEAPDDPWPWPTALVLPCPCTYRARLEQWVAQRNLQLEGLTEFGSVEAIVGGVAAGLGFSLLPRSVVRHSPFRGGLREQPIAGPLADMPTVLLRNGDMPRHRALAALVAALDRWQATDESGKEWL